jgi:hypothetical protein
MIDLVRRRAMRVGGVRGRYDVGSSVPRPNRTPETPYHHTSPSLISNLQRVFLTDGVRPLPEGPNLMGTGYAPAGPA